VLFVRFVTNPSVPANKLKVWDKVEIDLPQTFFDFWDLFEAHGPNGRLSISGSQETLNILFKTFGPMSMIARSV
jgi:hypothetical protein